MKKEKDLKNLWWQRGLSHPCKGKHWKLSDITKKRMSLVKIGKKRKPFSKEHKRKMSEVKVGEKSYLWKGGIAYSPYPDDWTNDLRDSIRKRDDYMCQMCGIHQDELNYKLDCHHIDYNKDNLNPNNLISLCRSCHQRTNYNRIHWIEYFKKGGD